MVKDHSDSEKENPQPPEQGFFYMHHPTYRIAHTTRQAKSDSGISENTHTYIHIYTNSLYTHIHIHTYISMYIRTYVMKYAEMKR